MSKFDFFNASSLTKDQLAARRTGVGGSDLREYILSGRWAELYDLKTGVVEDKMDPFSLPMQLGIHLEPFHRAWFEHTQKRVVHPDNRTHRITDADFALCNIDGYLVEDGKQYPWEGKVLGGYAKWEDTVEKYMPQCQWICFVTGRPRIAFSALLGNSALKWDWIEADVSYGAQLFDLVATFWRKHMLTGVRPPSQGTPIVPPKQPLPPGEPITVDMHGNNQWPEAAAKWLNNRKAATDFEDAEDELKRLVPAGAGVAFGIGVKVTVSKNGAKKIAALTDKDAKVLPGKAVKYVDLVKEKKA